MVTKNVLSHPTSTNDNLIIQNALTKLLISIVTSYHNRSNRNIHPLVQTMSPCQVHFVSLLLLHNSVTAVQHKLIITLMESIADPDYGNFSVTLVDSKIANFNNKYTIENAIITAELNVKTNENGNYTSFFRKRFDFCQFMRNPQQDPLLYMAYKAITMDERNYMCTKCPIKSVSHGCTQTNWNIN